MGVLITTDGRGVFVNLHIVDGKGEYQVHRWEDYTLVNTTDDAPLSFKQGGGYTLWLRDGVIHRDGAPARITARGVRLWYQNGRLHRTDGPAIERPDGVMSWYNNGKYAATVADFIIKAKIPQAEAAALMLRYG